MRQTAVRKPDRLETRGKNEVKNNIEIREVSRHQSICYFGQLLVHLEVEKRTVVEEDPCKGGGEFIQMCWQMKKEYGLKEATKTE